MFSTRLFPLVALVAGVSISSVQAQQGVLLLQKGDHIAIVGSGVADRQQHHGWLESLIHRAYPDLDLTVRNLGFATDEVNVSTPFAGINLKSFDLSLRLTLAGSSQNVNQRLNCRTTQ